jgi:seryl-tRNA synthetase
MPLDITLFRDPVRAESVRESQRRRGASVELVDMIVELDQKLRVGTYPSLCSTVCIICV